MQLPKLEKLAANPWALIAFGALGGVWLATTHDRAEDPERGLVMGLVGGLVLKLVRDAALAQMGRIAHTWIAEPEIPPPTPFAS
jgi:hypothetical protein